MSGTVTITYEDAFGQEYTETAEVSSHIAEKSAPEPTQAQKRGRRTVIGGALLGLAVGGGFGFGISWLVKDRKRRQEDNLRL